MAYFQYGQKEIDYLKKKDKRLAQAIEKIGHIEREINTDVFASLVEIIVGQQISSKAAQTVCNRFYELPGGVTPMSIAQTDPDTIQKLGMTMKKAGYIKDIAEAAVSGRLDIAALHTMSDDAIIKELTSFNGIGTWTAEMVLIFSLCRPDVISYGDLAIRRGLMNLYDIKELSRDQFEKFRKRCSPYGSVASLYLWQISHGDGKNN